MQNTDRESSLTRLDSVQERPPIPGGLVVLPQSASQVVDPDEEVFLLYSRPFQNKDSDGIQGLGSVDSLAGTLSLSLTLRPRPDVQSQEPQTTGRYRRKKAQRRASKAEKDDKVIQVELFQDVTSLRSRKGDTGSVVWRASVHLARLFLQQHYFPPQGSALLDPKLLPNAHIVELGSGTGILGCALPPLLSDDGHITLTDLPELVPLLRKNARSRKVSVEPLDWTWPLLPKFTADLALCVDCIYNTALVRPLVRVLATFEAPILVVIELRDPDVVREFLGEWLASSRGFQVWRLSDGLLDPHFVAWVGWKA